jgi:hypothetical protein
MSNYKNKLIAMKAKRKRAKPIGSVVQSPDQQYATGMMGKQPVNVYPLMGKEQKKDGMR